MKKIIHVDMDYFFAQVEELTNPELKDKPFAVGGSYSGKGVVSTSNYIARKFGVKSAMSSFEAMKRCPDIIFVRSNYDNYIHASRQVFEVFHDYTSKIQKISLDEAYLDVTDCELFGNDAQAIAKQIKADILEKTGLTASAGVSYNKLLAKIGSELFKPNGLAILRPEGIDKKIRHFPVERIQGIGKVTQKRMNEFGLYTFGDLQDMTKLQLINHFGDFGASLYEKCRGIDHSEVASSRLRKSLSVENTFFQNLEKPEEMTLKVEHTFDELNRRLKRHSDVPIKNLFVKIKYHDFHTSTVEGQAEYSVKNFLKLFERRWRERKEPVRLLGLGVKFKLPQRKKYQLEFNF